MSRTTRYLLTLFAFAALSNAQVSPAQGPSAPSANAVIRDIPVQGVVTALLKTVTEQSLADINTTLAARTDARARVSLKKINVWAPGMTQTQFTDRPNHRLVRVPYILEFKVDNIQWAGGTYNCNVPNPPPGCPAIDGQINWHNYPWSRTVTMSVDVNNFCDGWELGSGHIRIEADPDPPYIDPDPGITEAIVNFFLNGHLVPFVNSKLQQGLKTPGRFSQTLTLTKCNTLQAFAGDPNSLADDAIQWSEPGFAFPNLLPGVTVRATHVKRLQARDLYNNILYNPVETPSLDFWAGFGHQYLQLPPMTEGQVVALTSPAISVVPRLAGSMSLVVIASTINGYTTESNFRVFPGTTYGAGTQTVTVFKTYTRPPSFPLFPKPTIVKVPAYEITFEVASPNTGTIFAF